MRLLNLASPLVLTLTLIACGGTKEHKTALQKTLGPGGRMGARLANKNTCPHLDEVLKRVGASSTGVLLHGYDYDLVADAKGAVVSAADATALTKLITYRSLRGPGAPALQTATSLGELLTSPPGDALLDVAEQKGCATVTFGSGYAFRVLNSDQRTLTLVNDETLETRTYTVAEHEVLIRQDLPKRLNDCAGPKQFERTESVTLRLAWGEAAGQVKLAEHYAGLIGAPTPSETPPTPPQKPGVRARVPVKPPKAQTSMPVFMFERLTRDATAKAAELRCQP